MKTSRASSVAAGAALALAVTVLTVAPSQGAPTTSGVRGASIQQVDAAMAAPRKKTKLKVKSPGKVVVQTKAFVKGKASGPKKRKVVLQLKTAYGWKNVDGDKTNKKGKYALKAPTNWYGQKKLRVMVPPTRSFQGKVKKLKVGINPGVLDPAAGVVVPYAPLGKKKSWTRLSPGRKTRYNPCQAVTYKYNPAGLPADGVAVSEQALFRIELANGIRYKNKGQTNAIPFNRNGRAFDNKANLTIAWSTPSTISELSGGVLAIGGFMRAAYVPQRKTYKLLKTGLVMDSTDDSYYQLNGRNFESGASMGAVIMHELTHASGMGHTNDITQVMYPAAVSSHPALFGKGDITGLKKHGVDAGCLSGSRNAISAPIDDWEFMALGKNGEQAH